MEKFFNITTNIIRWICLILLFGLTLIVFAKVLFRYMLNSPLVWSDEVIMLALLTLTYFGAALAAENRSHIRVELIDILMKRWSLKALKIYYLISDVFMSVVLCFVIYFGVTISLYSRDQETDILLISYFWVYILMPVGLIFMILLIAKRIYNDWFVTGPVDGNPGGSIGEKSI